MTLRQGRIIGGIVLTVLLIVTYGGIGYGVWWVARAVMRYFGV